MKRHSMWSLGAAALISTLAVGCVGNSSAPNVDRKALAKYVLTKPPTSIPHKLDTKFESKVVLLGYKISPENSIKPGGEIKLTMYWKCLQDVPAGWNLFTHVLDGSNNKILNVDNVGPLRQWVGKGQVLPPANWKPGKIYVDEQTFRLPEKLNTDKVTIVTGIWKGTQRFKIVSGPADKENRAIVATLKTGVKVKHLPPKPSARIKSIRVPHLDAKEKITINGKLDEAAWKKAVTTGPFVDVGTGARNPSFPVQGNARLLWDDKNLYVAFEVKSKHIVGGWPKDAKDPHLWEKDTVEIMLDPDSNGDNKDYYEIQINPQNLVFDTQYDSYNQPKNDKKGIFGHMDWSAKLKSAVVVDGKLDAPGQGKGYTVEAAIPWSSFTKAKHAPPKPGESWRMNFYAMKNNSGVAWSPILGQGNFHKASRFGRVIWSSGSEVRPAGSAPRLIHLSPLRHAKPGATPKRK